MNQWKSGAGVVIATLCLGWAGAAFAADSDSDGVDDAVDNCTAVANADQLDADGDGYGNLCDADYDNDGIVGEADYAILHNAFGAVDGEEDYSLVLDHDNDGVIAGTDLGIHGGMVGKPVGPSGLR